MHTLTDDELAGECLTSIYNFLQDLRDETLEQVLQDLKTMHMYTDTVWSMEHYQVLVDVAEELQEMRKQNKQLIHAGTIANFSKMDNQ